MKIKFSVHNLFGAALAVNFIALSRCTKTTKMYTVPNYEKHYRFPFTQSNRTIVRSRLGCAQQCGADESCKAMNVKKDGDRYVCEMSNTFAATYGAMESDENSRYYEKERCLNGGQWDSDNDICTQCQYWTSGKHCDEYLEDCNDAWLKHVDKQNTGTYNILVKPPNAVGPFMIVCQMRHKGVISAMKRNISAQSSESFYRSWEDYKNGFGDTTREYFLGLQKLHFITQKYCRLKLSVTLQGVKHACNYYGFKIESEANTYALRYSSTVAGDGMGGDGFNYGLASGRLTDNTPFCTYDRDCNDCAKNSNSGWWFNINCTNVNLHGLKNDTGSFEWLISSQMETVDTIEYLLFSY